MNLFLNTCIDCKKTTNVGVWKVDIKKGPISTSEYYDVRPEECICPEHFDLDSIDAEDIASRYKITIEEAEEAIMDGEVMCPFCKSLNFFEYDKEIDKETEVILL